MFVGYRFDSKHLYLRRCRNADESGRRVDETGNLMLDAYSISAEKASASSRTTHGRPKIINK